YKIQLSQQINEDDFDRRLEFCEIISTRAVYNPNFLFNVCFSDECTFYLNGIVNRHNCRYWADSNLRILHEVHTQHLKKLNVWAGIFGNRIVGPLFLLGTSNLTAEMYLELLEDIIDPMLTDVIENDEHYLEDQLVFQQDGASPHYAISVRRYLDQRF
ncbi:hypothetical protein EAI_08475, partial [Harpegnathos saltator]